MFYYNKFKKEYKKIDKHLVLRRHRVGMDRLYYKLPTRYVYITEVPHNLSFETHKYNFNTDYLKKKKNYIGFLDRIDEMSKKEVDVLGYYKMIDKITNYIYLLKNNKEFNYAARVATTGSVL